MPRNIPSLCAALLLAVAPAAWAEPGVWLPTTEDPAAWESPLALAGLEQIASPGPALVRILDGDLWTLQVSDGHGGDRSIQVAPPTTGAEREALALVAAGLARELAARRTPQPPPPPPLADTNADAVIVAAPLPPASEPVVPAEILVEPLTAPEAVNPWSGVLAPTPLPADELVSLDPELPRADETLDEDLLEDLDLERGQRRNAFGTREPRTIPVAPPPAARGTGPQLRFASLRLAVGTSLMPAASPGFSTQLSSRVTGGDRWLVEAGVGLTPGQVLQFEIQPGTVFVPRRTRSTLDLLVVAGPRTHRLHVGAVAGASYHWYGQNQLLATFLVPTLGVQIHGEPNWMEDAGFGLVGRVLTTPVRTTMVMADGSRSQSTPVEVQLAATVRFGRWW